MAYSISEIYATLGEFENIQIIAKYKHARNIISSLVNLGYEIAFANEFAAPEWDDYEDEFVISISDDFEIWIEPAKKDGKYLEIDGKVIFLLDDCNSKIIPNLISEAIYETTICDEEDLDDCDGDCDLCNCSEKDSVTYKVNGKPVDKKTFVEAINKMDDDYTDNIQDMLLRYCKLQDEMNGWRKLLYL